MARRSLKPQLNQIRAWVQQGRTDAWIAHQLEISASELREFRKQHDLTPDGESAGGGEVDLRDEIEAEVEAATAEEEAEEEEAEEPEPEDDDGDGDEGEDKPPARKRRKAEDGDEGEDGEERTGARPRRRRRRGRRGGRGRRKDLEATFDHGERDGYGLWLDAAVKDNPVYAEHWAGKREVTVRIDADQIVIRRAGETAASSDDDSDE
jgi:hypothetical protein